MNLISDILDIICASIIIYVQLLAFSKLSNNNKITINIKNILIILFGAIIIVINTNLNTSILRMIISFITLLIMSLVLYKNSISRTLMNLLFAYIITIFYEIILSIGLLSFIDSYSFDNSILIKNIFSIITIILVYFTCSNKYIIDFLRKQSSKLETAKYDIIFSFSIILLLMNIDVLNYNSGNIQVLLYDLTITICVIYIIIYAVYSHVKSEKELNKIDILLSFIKKYERVIDKDRILRHEILNNLLILNSFEDKNSKEYNEMLGELIKTYSNNNHIKFKNLHKLPSGIKGLLYYKLYGLDDKKINVNIRIDKTLPTYLNKLNSKDYQVLCKILNILLDNAIEASLRSKEKIINIEIFKEKKDCIIIIENSCNNNVDLAKLENKYYSTKGKRRGLGLFIVKELTIRNERIQVEREINNKIFTSKIIIK